MAKEFAYDDIMNSTATVEEKKMAIIDRLIETNVISTVEDEYVLNREGASALLNNIRKDIKRVSGLRGGSSRVGTKNYLESIKNNFYEHPEVKDLEESDKKELFHFLTSRAGGTVSGAYKDYSDRAVGDKLTAVEQVGERYPKSKVNLAGMDAREFVDTLYNDLTEYENAVVSRDASKKIKDDLVNNGTYAFEQIKIMEEKYNTYIADHERVPEVDNFFSSIGATVDEHGVAWGKSFKEFVDHERDNKLKITKRMVDGVNRKFNKPEDNSIIFEFPETPDPRTEVREPEVREPEEPVFSTPRASGSQYLLRRRGFFSRVGRWMGKHPIITSAIVVGLLGVGTLAINPVFALSYLGTGLLIGAGAVASTGATKGIVYLASPRYRNYCYDYDIEKNFRAVSKARTKCENILSRVVSLAGNDIFAELNVIEDRQKKAVAREMVASGRIDNNTIKKIKEIVGSKKSTVNKLNKSNNKKLEKIANIIDKKKVNAIDLGYNTDIEKDLFVEDFTQGREFEERRLNENVQDLKNARALKSSANARRHRRSGEERER